MRLYLNVPYGEKGEAKALGAKWDPRVKKWYTDSDPDHYVRFAKWILRETDDVLIATEYLHIIEGGNAAVPRGWWDSASGNSSTSSGNPTIRSTSL